MSGAREYGWRFGGVVALILYVAVTPCDDNLWELAALCAVGDHGDVFYLTVALELHCGCVEVHGDDEGACGAFDVYIADRHRLSGCGGADGCHCHEECMNGSHILFVLVMGVDG